MKPTQRMIGIFPGGVQHPHHLNGANRFSPSSHAQPRLSLQSTEGTRCGRKLDRDRRPYRVSRQVTSQNSFHLATLNTQGLECSSLKQRHELQHAILAARKYKWDLLLLSELQDRDNPKRLARDLISSNNGLTVSRSSLAEKQDVYKRLRVEHCICWRMCGLVLSKSA